MLRAAALVLGLLALSAPAFAASETDRRDCSGESSPDRKIAACTHVLEDANRRPPCASSPIATAASPTTRRPCTNSPRFDFDEALETRSERHPSLGARGNAYAQRGQYDRGIADFTEILRRNPRNPIGPITIAASSSCAKAISMRPSSDFDAALQHQSDAARTH